FKSLPTSLASQMKRLGYDTIYWYGGNASYGNLITLVRLKDLTA
ncbi:Arylsulfatase, partial [human gut metagenome]